MYAHFLNHIDWSSSEGSHHRSRQVARAPHTSTAQNPGYQKQQTDTMNRELEWTYENIVCITPYNVRELLIRWKDDPFVVWTAPRHPLQAKLIITITRREADERSDNLFADDQLLHG